MASSHPPPQSHHHAQPLPPSGHIHHPPYASHPPPPSRLPSGSYQNGPSVQPSSSGPHSIANRHLPPLASSSAQSPQYSHRHDATLPPLSPFSQRSSYAPPPPPGGSFPPPLSRSGSSQHNGSASHSYHQPPPPHPSSHYQPPPPGHGHWDRHDQPPPPPPSHPAAHHSQPPPPPGPSRNASSSSNLNKSTRRPSIASERESTAAPESAPAASASASAPREEDGGPPASDFVKKLAKMLDDPSFSNVVCWGPKGDCFVVKDMTEFTKSILPRMFKHSNFASFVRQLNKYDFHKIKNVDDTLGDQSWTFHHPDFQRSNRDALENIKRKVPAQRKGGRGGAATGPALPGSPNDGALGLTNADSSAATQAMQAQIDALSRSNDDMAAQLGQLERNYQNVLNEMVAYQRGMAAQDNLMQNLISYFIQLESGKNEGLGKVMEAYGDAARPYPLVPGMSFSGSTASVGSDGTVVSGSSPELSPIERSMLARQESLQRLEELKRATEARNASAASSSTMSSTDGMGAAVAATPQSAPFVTSLNPDAAAAAAASQQATRVFSSGQPRGGQTAEQAQAEANAAAAAAAAMPPPAQMPQPPPEWSYADQNQMPMSNEVPEAQGGPSFAPQPSAGPSFDMSGLLNSPGNKARIRLQKGAFGPTWAVPPRVLLVDDDQVSRKLFSKFLQVSGCTIDVAVDGIGAVNKMNLEKYDLVLMDIVMPKLDGVSATSLIRQFDVATPIISMTSNSKPNDVVTYYSSGMNDILPKPFTREGLFTMLEKHLMHLKAIHQSIAKPEDMSAKNAMPSLSDEQYSNMLTNLLGMDGPFGALNPSGMMDDLSGAAAPKRPLDSLDDDREPKRGRFEVVE